MTRYFWIVLLLGGTAPAAELVTEFEGNTDATTTVFEVDGPWLLDWRLYGDRTFPITGSYTQKIALEISLVDATTGRFVGRVLESRHVGDGLKLFDQGGRYQLRISSTLGRWHIKIEQLEPEEVELYTPKETGKKKNPFDLSSR